MENTKMEAAENVKAGSKPTEQQINQWKTQYGDVYKIESDDDDLLLSLYFRKPTRQHLSRFTKSVSGQGDAIKALHNLVQDTLIYPSMDVLTPLLTEKPGLIIPIGTQLQEVVGTNKNFFAKRL